MSQSKYQGCRSWEPLTPEEVWQCAAENLAYWMIDHSFETGHGDTMNDLLKELSWQVQELRK